MATNEVPLRFLYAATVHPASAVSAACACQLVGPSLAVAKGNVLEIYSLSESSGADGMSRPEHQSRLVLAQSVSVHGRITALAPLFTRDSDSIFGKSHNLFVLTEKKMFVVLTWDSQNSRLVVVASGDVKDRLRSDLDTPQRLLVDRSGGHLLGIYAQENLLKIISLRSLESFDVRLENLIPDLLRPLDMAFMPGTSSDPSTLPVLGVVYESCERNVQFRAFQIFESQTNSAFCEFSFREIEGLASSLAHSTSLFIPASVCGNDVLFISDESISYCHENGSRCSLDIRGTCCPIMTYTPLENGSDSFVLSDANGNLFLLSLLKTFNGIEQINLNFLGTSSIPVSVSYLEDNLLFVGSAYGDSQLLSMTPTRSKVMLLSTVQNIGPILDMQFVKGDNASPSQLIACCGGFGSGSLRSIRSGVEFEEVANIELEGLKYSWALYNSSGADLHSYLVQSYVGESRILSIIDSDISELEDTGAFDVSTGTVFCGNLIENLIVQVTSNSCVLMNAADLSFVSKIDFENPIIIAKANSKQLLLSSAGGLLSYYELDSASRQLVLVSSSKFDFDIASFSFKFEEKLAVSNDGDFENESYVAVGFWTENIVRILKLPSLEVIHSVPLVSDSQIRDVLLVDFNLWTYLLVGMGDGSLIRYSVYLGDKNDMMATDNCVQVEYEQKLSIGSRPIALTPFIFKGRACVFASGEYPVIFYSDGRSIQYSNVDVESNISMAALNCSIFRFAVCMCTNFGMRILNLKSVQKSYIVSYPVEGSPRRLAFHESTKAVVLASDGPNCSSVSFYESATMNKFSSFDLNPSEEICSCISCVIDFCGNAKEVIVIGTLLRSDREISEKGRILIIELSEQFDSMQSTKIGYKIETLVDETFPGGVLALTSISSGYLVAAYNSKVSLLIIVEYSDPLRRYRLQSSSRSTYQGGAVVISLKSQGDKVLVGDLILGQAILGFHKSDKSIWELSAERECKHLRAIEYIDSNEEAVLGADDCGNLYCSVQCTMKTMPTVCEYHLGDYINVFRKGSLISRSSKELVTAAASTEPNMMVNSFNPLDSNDTTSPHTLEDNSFLYGSVSGAIGAVIVINERDFDLFSALQDSILDATSNSDEYAVESCFSFADWRSFANENRTSPCRNVIDGDLVQSFKYFPTDLQESIAGQCFETLKEKPWMDQMTKIDMLRYLEITVDRIGRFH